MQILSISVFMQHIHAYTHKYLSIYNAYVCNNPLCNFNMYLLGLIMPFKFPDHLPITYTQNKYRYFTLVIVNVTKAGWLHTNTQQ